MKNSKKIVVKIGTNVLADSRGKLDIEIMKSMVKQIAEVKNSNKKIILVTSGAIGAGIGELNLNSTPDNILMRQVCAAVGQSILMARYYNIFGKYGIKVAQVLITYDTFDSKKQRSHMENSINKLLDLDIIPIVNENDPISIEEIDKYFGDNDIMCAKLAVTVKADLLLMLTNVDGLYDRNPKEKGAKLITEVSGDIKYRLKGKSALGIGGMQTKLEAAKLANKSGIKAIIANGRKEGTVSRLLRGEKEGTLFVGRA